MKDNLFLNEKNKKPLHHKLSFWLLSTTFVSSLFIAYFFIWKNQDVSSPPLTSTPLVKPPTQKVAYSDISTLVAGNTQFALDIYKQISSPKNATENVSFSPYSISSALGMTSAGAKGNTITQMNKVMNFTLPSNTLHPAFGELNYQLTNTQGYQLSIANRLWANNNLSLLPSFAQITDDFYGAKIESLNFSYPKQAATTINQWVSDKTQNQIKDLLNECLLGKTTKLVLTNAIYFKGNWQDKFDANNTQSKPFYLASGKQEKVPLMYQSSHFKYGEDTNLQVLEMPYQGNKLSMVILLPNKPDGLPNLESNLTTDNLRKWLLLRSEKVDLWLPKLKVEQKLDLGDTLTNMGMADAFDNHGKANFSGINNQDNLYISKVIHKAFVEVDESGTKAAAATAVIMNGCKGGDCPKAAAPAPPRPKVFRADRPFLFLIKDKQSGSILFMGRFVNPLATNEKQEGGLCRDNTN